MADCFFAKLVSQFFRQPLLGQLLQIPDLKDLGQAGLLDQIQLGSGVHDLQLGLAVPGRGEEQAHGEGDPALVVAQRERVNHEPRLSFRQFVPQIVGGNVVEGLIGHEGHRVAVDLHHDRPAGRRRRGGIAPETEFLQLGLQGGIDSAHGNGHDGDDGGGIPYLIPYV